MPVCRISTKRGTQSAAAITVAYSADEAGSPDSVVLTSSILIEKRGDRGEAFAHYGSNGLASDVVTQALG